MIKPFEILTSLLQYVRLAHSTRNDLRDDVAPNWRKYNDNEDNIS